MKYAYTGIPPPLFSQEPEETDIRPPLSPDSADMVLLNKER